MNRRYSILNNQMTSVKIFLCNICPRTDTYVGYINDIIQRLFEQHNAKLVDIESAFHDRHEKIIERYYDTDGIHLSSSGVKRLLVALNKHVLLVNDFDNCFSPKILRKRPNHFPGRIGQNCYRFGRIASIRKETTYMHSATNVEKIITKLVTVELRNS